MCPFPPLLPSYKESVKNYLFHSNRIDSVRSFMYNEPNLFYKGVSLPLWTTRTVATQMKT